MKPLEVSGMIETCLHAQLSLSQQKTNSGTIVYPSADYFSSFVFCLVAAHMLNHITVLCGM